MGNKLRKKDVGNLKIADIFFGPGHDAASTVVLYIGHRERYSQCSEKTR